jgi:hypothetical protein
VGAVGAVAERVTGCGVVPSTAAAGADTGDAIVVEEYTGDAAAIPRCRRFRSVRMSAACW